MAEKVIIVTGASSGIGKGTALYMAEKGTASAITLVARKKDALEATANEIKEKYPSVKTLVVVGDVSSESDNKKMVEETIAAFGAVHGAFLNAGVFAGGKPLHESPDEMIDQLFNTNMKSIVYALRYLIPAIKTTVGDNGPTGSIVVNSSVMGQSVIGPKSAGAGLYSASKAFVNSLVETAAIENAPRIRVNSVMPGVVQTNIMPFDDVAYDEFGSKAQSLWGRAGRPHEVASLVSYLLSDEASFISGSNVLVDGLFSKVGGSFE